MDNAILKIRHKNTMVNSAISGTIMVLKAKIIKDILNKLNTFKKVPCKTMLHAVSLGTNLSNMGSRASVKAK